MTKGELFELLAGVPGDTEVSTAGMETLVVVHSPGQNCVILDGEWRPFVNDEDRLSKEYQALFNGYADCDDWRGQVTQV